MRKLCEGVSRWTKDLTNFTIAHLSLPASIGCSFVRPAIVTFPSSSPSPSSFSPPYPLSVSVEPPSTPTHKLPVFCQLIFFILFNLGGAQLYV